MFWTIVFALIFVFFILPILANFVATIFEAIGEGFGYIWAIALVIFILFLILIF